MNRGMREIVLKRLSFTKRVIIIRTHKNNNNALNKRRQNILKNIREHFLRAMLVDPDEREMVTEYQPTNADILNAWLFS